MTTETSTIHKLKKVPIFSSLDEKSLKKIASISHKKFYRKNEIVFHEGDTGSSLFLLVSGTVKISINSEDGKETILNIIYEGDYFGEMSLLDGCFRSATVTALESSKALVIFRKDFIDFIEKRPAAVLDIVATLNRRLRKATKQIESLTFYDVYGKVAKILLDLAEDKGKKAKGHTVIDIPISRQELAAMAGTSRETLTRVLHEFQIRGCLKVDGKHLTILDEGILKREIL